MFDKSAESFPIKKEFIFLSYCSVSPLYGPAAEEGSEFLFRQSQAGRTMYEHYSGSNNVAIRFHKAAGELLKTDFKNISAVCNTAEALCMIANGYPFEPGDQVIGYCHEYPANHYPWVLQQKQRGVDLVLLSDKDPSGKLPGKFPKGWDFAELEEKVTERTKVIALRHVQFTSGFAVDLKKLGAFCRDRGIDLVIDAAQSLGALPVYPEEYGIAAIGASGWKWLCGPASSAVMYTSEEFRAKIEITMSGSDHMKQGDNYLDYTWAPYEDGRKFEYSTLAYPCLIGLAKVIEDQFLKHSLEDIREEIFRLQEIIITGLDPKKYTPLVHAKENRSGILPVIPLRGADKEISAKLREKGVIVTPRDGYLRFAPHCFTSDEEVRRAVEVANSI